MIIIERDNHFIERRLYFNIINSMKEINAYRKHVISLFHVLISPFLFKIKILTWKLSFQILKKKKKNHSKHEWDYYYNTNRCSKKYNFFYHNQTFNNHAISNSRAYRSHVYNMHSNFWRVKKKYKISYRL